MSAEPAPPPYRLSYRMYIVYKLYINRDPLIALAVGHTFANAMLAKALRLHVSPFYFRLYIVRFDPDQDRNRQKPSSSYESECQTATRGQPVRCHLQDPPKTAC